MAGYSSSWLGSFVVRQRAAADAMKLTAKIACFNPEFDWSEIDQNVLICPVVVGLPGGLRKLYGGDHPAPWALQPLGPFVAPGHCRGIRCHSTNIALSSRQSQPAALPQSNDPLPPLLFDLKATPAEYTAGLKLAIERGWLEMHESGTYVKFTQAGAEMFA